MSRIDEIRARLAAATPGPWYVHDPDDEMFMGARVVSVSPDEPSVDCDERYNDHGAIIAITLLQSPRVVDIDDGRWDENADLIAHAPADMAYLLEEVARLCAALEQVAEMKSIIGARKIVQEALADKGEAI